MNKWITLAVFAFIAYALFSAYRNPVTPSNKQFKETIDNTIKSSKDTMSTVKEVVQNYESEESRIKVDKEIGKMMDGVMVKKPNTANAPSDQQSTIQYQQSRDGPVFTVTNPGFVARKAAEFFDAYAKTPSGQKLVERILESKGMISRHEVLSKQLPEVPVYDIESGNGSEKAYCGTKVSATYKLSIMENEIYATQEPVYFRIGDARILPGVEIGTIGMSPGGKRSAAIPSYLAYDYIGFSSNNVPAGTTISAEINLLKVYSDKNYNTSESRIFVNQYGTGHKLICTDCAIVSYALYDIHNKLLYSSNQQQAKRTTCIGRSDTPLLFNYALSDMLVGSDITVLVPYSMMMSSDGKINKEYFPDNLKLSSKDMVMVNMNIEGFSHQKPVDKQ